MIKLDRRPKPVFLTEAKVAELTAEFKTNGTAVWNIDEIKTPLLQSSSEKCAYCECSLALDSNYMEVEHFEDKKSNPGKVVEWENLLPSCKTCNGAKSSHDVISEPIVNPYIDDPRAHLAMRVYRIRPKTDIGKTTIDVTNLNHSDRHVQSRFLIGEKVNELIDSACERFEAFEKNGSVRSRNKALSSIEGLLKECQPESNYAASTATLVLTTPEFNILIESMRVRGIWTPELERMLNKAKLLVLEVI